LLDSDLSDGIVTVRGKGKKERLALLGPQAVAAINTWLPDRAALLTKAGEIISGANVESASYGLTCCAERVALFNALTAGKMGFVAVAVVARAPGGPMPCGACRQLLAEYAPNAAVWVADSRALHRIKEFSVRELLPAAFVEVPADSD